MNLKVYKRKSHQESTTFENVGSSIVEQSRRSILQTFYDHVLRQFPFEKITKLPSI
jgi:hypothetical protein